MEQDRGVAPKERGKTSLWRQLSPEKSLIRCTKLVFQEACMALAVLPVARKTGGFLLLCFPDLSSVFLSQARSFFPSKKRPSITTELRGTTHTSPSLASTASVGLALVSPTTPLNPNQKEWGPESGSALTSWPSLGPSVPGMAASFNPSVYLDTGGSLQIDRCQAVSSSATHPQAHPISPSGF